MTLMLDHASAADWAAVLGSVLGALVVLGGWLKWVRPKWRRFKGDVTGTRDAILGRDAIKDTITGREIEPALPGIGQRMATVENHMATMAQTVATLAEAQQRNAALETRVDAHEERIGALERATQERIATRAENAAALGLVARLHESSDKDDEDD